jgi:hypothetical protein
MAGQTNDHFGQLILNSDPADCRDWTARLGAACQINEKTVIKGRFGIVYGANTAQTSSTTNRLHTLPRCMIGLEHAPRPERRQ